jgi:MOSC domain-containing protein YiiM
MHAPHGRLASVNVGRPQTISWRGRAVTSGIWKTPVTGPVAVHGVNLDGDDQADRQVHGGPDKAVYAYGLPDYRFWESELGTPPPPGLFGENLTVDGLDVSAARIGERWQVGSALFEVCQPRVPCYKLGIRLGDPQFPRRFAAAGRPGAYLRIVEEGSFSAGDPVVVVDRPDHEVSVAFVAHVYHADRRRLPRLLEIPELAVSWRDWAASMLLHSAPVEEVPIARYDTAMEGNMWTEVLRKEGIPARLVPLQPGSNWGLETMVPQELRVRPEDAARARDLLGVDPST